MILDCLEIERISNCIIFTTFSKCKLWTRIICKHAFCVFSFSWLCWRQIRSFLWTDTVRLAPRHGYLPQGRAVSRKNWKQQERAVRFKSSDFTMPIFYLKIYIMQSRFFEIHIDINIALKNKIYNNRGGGTGGTPNFQITDNMGRRAIFCPLHYVLNGTPKYLTFHRA